MTTRDADLASAPVTEEDFFESAPSSEDNLPFDLRPVDPILERKMTPDVRIRRVRFSRVVAGVVGCGVLLLLAALAHLRFTAGHGVASAETPATEMHATATRPAGR
jgi:hypothetical protein